MQHRMALSLNRALLGAVGVAILAGVIPAAVALDRRLQSALEDRASGDLALAPRVLADRLAANASTLMMYAKDLAHTDGLAAAVQEMIGKDPFGGAVFVFRSKRADRIKILVWDRTGWC